MSKVLVTGAAGLIGGAVVRALVAAGHSVTGVVRAESRRAPVEAAGATPLVATTQELSAPGRAAELAAFDVIVHASADKSDYQASEEQWVSAVLAAAKPAGGARPALVYTSGCFVLGGTPEDSTVTEATELDVPEALRWRHALEARVVAGGPRNAAVRPGFVWGHAGSLGSKWFLATRKEGHSTVAGPGGLFPWVHADDLGRAYAALVARLGGKDAGAAEAASGVYNIGDGRASLEHKDVFAAFSRAAGAGGAVVHTPIDEARASMGAFADLLNLRQGLVSADKIRALGWEPQHGTVIDGAASWIANLEAAHPDA